MPMMRRCRATNCHAMCAIPHWYCAKHIDQEADYLATRERWARGHDANYQHKYNTVTRNRTAEKREQYNFYRTRQWSHLRQQVLERDHYLCAYCKVKGVITPAKIADHIVPIEFDETLKANVDNLAVICGSCHHKKTEFEQKYYGTGNGNTLKDVEPIADINRIVLMMNEKEHD